MDPTAPSPEEDAIDVDLLDYLQTLTPAQRIERHEAALELVRALRKAGADHHGFDPHAVELAGMHGLPKP